MEYSNRISDIFRQEALRLADKGSLNLGIEISCIEILDSLDNLKAAYQCMSISEMIDEGGSRANAILALIGSDVRSSSSNLSMPDRKFYTSDALFKELRRTLGLIFGGFMGNMLCQIIS